MYAEEGGQRETSRRDLASSYLIQSDVRPSRSNSPLPHEKKSVVEDAMEYRRYNEQTDRN